MKRPSAPLDRGSHQDPAMSISMCMSSAFRFLKAFFMIFQPSLQSGIIQSLSAEQLQTEIAAAPCQSGHGTLVPMNLGQTSHFA